MKKLRTLLFILTSTVVLQAQEFETTTNYTITEGVQDKGQEYAPYDIKLVASNSETTVATFTITEPDTFETVLITTLQNPGLEGVEEVLKVEIEYLACCAFVETHYFLATTAGGFIALPQIENTYCETTLSELNYTFPIQEYGIENNILKTEKLYTSLGEISYVGLKQSYAWNDDDFGTTRLAVK